MASERNKAVIEAYYKHQSFQIAGDLFGISKQRAYQIFKQSGYKSLGTNKRHKNEFQILKAYANGMPLADIYKKYNVGYYGFQSIMKRHKLKPRPRCKEYDKKLAVNYFHHGMTMFDIAERCRVDLKVLRAYFKSLGLDTSRGLKFKRRRKNEKT